MIKHFIVPQGEMRADVMLSEIVPKLTRSGAQKLLDSGKVISGGHAVRKNEKLSAGTEVSVDFPEPQPTAILQQEIPLDVVYEDEDVIVINKQRGMVVHPAPGHTDGTLVNALMHHCGDSLSGIGGELRPGIVHRIDKDTSGLLIVAKNDLAHQGLSAQLKDHTLSRVYEAVVHGRIKNDIGTVDAPIGRHPTDRKRQCVTAKNSRSAITHYEVIDRYRDFTHVRCVLETGRTHQIRVHMAHIGHPLLGDLVYGRKTAEKGLEGQCLHARTLCFIHPRTREYVEVTCPLPEYFHQVLGKLGSKEE